jgi:hypothetical protein
MSKSIINDQLVAFRVPAAAVAQARQVAQLQGMSLSAYLRQGLRRQGEIYLLHEKALLMSVVN